ncbi:hypothetical protein Tco_1522641 [Tanacetum coccineum]
MGDENPIRTLGDYSNPSHRAKGNTIEAPLIQGTPWIHHHMGDLTTHILHTILSTSEKARQEHPQRDNPDVPATCIKEKSLSLSMRNTFQRTSTQKSSS